MKLVLQNPNIEPGQLGKDLNVLILGEDPGMTARAGETLGMLEHKLKTEGRLIYRKWDFEGLVHAAMREVASAEAAAADIIVIGIRENQALPWIVQAWMERCLELRKARAGALVAVLDADVRQSDVSKEMLLQLKKLAAAGHMDFFVRSSQGDRERWDDTRASAAARPFAMSWMQPGGRSVSQKNTNGTGAHHAIESIFKFQRPVRGGV